MKATKKVEKTCEMKSLELTSSDLDEINKFTLEPLSSDDVYAFKVVMGDNELDDRNDMPFTMKALEDLKALYPGKPVISNHQRNNVSGLFARVYDTDITIDESKKTLDGKPYAQLIGKCYMAKSDSNAGLIADIRAGIKKEVSTSCSCKSLVCNICGTDNVEKECNHWPGRTYTVDGEEKRCLFSIDGVSDAYELSFVTIPAQPRAGTTKEAEEEDEEKNKDISEKSSSKNESEKIRLQLELWNL